MSIIAGPLNGFPDLPLSPSHWKAIVHAMRLSPKQAGIVELMLRGMGEKQIALALKIRPSTLRTYLERISARTKTHGRMELAMLVLATSHQVQGVPENVDTRFRPQK
jgi:DNA-binding NarL/FixJ family response regulator